MPNTTFRRAVLVCAMLLAAAHPLIAQAQSHTEEHTTNPNEPASSFAFEVATIKQAAPSPDGHTHINYPAGGGFSAINIPLSALMQWAYDVQEKRILKQPAWLTSQNFDIQAKADPETDARLRAMTSEQANEAKHAMVQRLLADRFGLKLHQETRQLTAYDLVPAKGGPKLAVTKSNGKSFGNGRDYFRGEGVDADLIAQQLSKRIGYVVVNKTSLPDRYDFRLQWTPDDASETESSAPPLFIAVEEQLGLKLVRTTEPVPVLVIDSIQQPSAN